MPDESALAAAAAAAAKQAQPVQFALEIAQTGARESRDRQAERRRLPGSAGGLGDVEPRRQRLSTAARSVSLAGDGTPATIEPATAGF